MGSISVDKRIAFQILIALLSATAATNSVAELLDASIPRPVTYEDMVGITDIGIWSQDDFDGPAISPDGKLLAFETQRSNVENNKIEKRWTIVSLNATNATVDAGDGGEPLPFLWDGFPNGNSLPQRPQWSPDSNSIVYRAKHGGEIQLWRSRKDGKQQQLTHNAADIESFRIVDANRIFFAVRNPRSEKQEELRDEGERGYLYDDRFVPIYSRLPIIDPAKQDVSVWVYETDSAVERIATQRERKEYLSESPSKNIDANGHRRELWQRSSWDKKSVVWLAESKSSPDGGIDRPKTIMARSAASGNREVPCSSSRCTGHFKGLWLDDTGKNTFFLRWIGEYNYGALALYRWDMRLNRVSEILRTNDLIEGCGKVDMRLICSIESASVPRRIVSISIQTGRIDPIFDPNPGFSRFQFGETTSLTWTDPNGVEGFGHLVKPIGYIPGRRYPLVIVQYRSRGFLRGGVGDEYPIHILAAKGFAVLSFHKPDQWKLKAASGSAEEVKAKGMEGFQNRRMILSVLRAGIRLLDHQGIIDPRKVGITGLSDGGETVAFALIHAPNEFAAAASSGTCCNPIVLFLGGPKNREWLRRMNLDYVEDDRTVERWREISLGLNARTIRTPLLLQVSDAEYEQETQTVEPLSTLGKPVEMYVFPNEYHIKSQPLHRYNIYRRNVQWFLFWLQGVEESDPIDAGQYPRWRTLRRIDGYDSMPAGTQ